MTRRGLKQRNGERLRFKGIVQRFGSKPGYHGGVIDTLLLRDVVEAETGETIANHVWFTLTKRWRNARVSVGDTVEFDARVKRYKKGYRGHDWRKRIESPPTFDYKLSYPSKVRVVV